MTAKSNPAPRSLALAAALPYIISYAAAALIGLVMLSPLKTSAIWPANAILISALLLLDRPSRLYCIVFCCAANIAAGLALGNLPLRVVALSALNLAECGGIAFLTRLVCGQNLNFSDAHRLLAFLAGAVAPTCAVAGLVLNIMAPFVHMPLGPSAGSSWFISHGLGAALIVPAVTAVANRRRFAALSRSPQELLAAMAALTAFSACLFWWQGQLSVLFLIFPAMMLTAFRYGPVGAAIGSLLVAAVAGLFVYSGLQTLSLGFAPTLQIKVQWLQFFIAAMFLTTLPAAGALASYARMRNLLARRSQTAREARRRADLAASAKGEFLANMSHEIRTPLNGVIGLADALSRTELAPAQREMLGMILTSGKALTGLLGDALDLARADSGALRLTEEPFDVRETIGGAAYLFETIAREKGLGFRVEFDLDPPGAVIGDPLRIRQVVSNLISNAVKFTSEGQVVLQVSLKPGAGGRMTLQAVVRDSGPGFGEDVKARLFNRFEQGDSSVTRRFGGSGLGLSIAHRLSQIMQATIGCESVPGLGSVFTFTVALPAAGPAEQPAPPERAPEVGVTGARLAVLLAEDHAINRKVIQAMLGDMADLTVAVDGRQAVDAFSTQAFDVVLMDTHMPVMDGLTAIRTIRDLERERGLTPTPIVSLTADAMPQQVDAAMAAGADLHVSKPITGESLFGALQACVRLRAQAEQQTARAAG